ncbi:4-hydroxyphenylacetate 3-hydroxylase family protein [Streptomyces sp. NPDC057686]|uniref:4-hydroxyphenylacetate 3-hydroxylase family protein n=1 Tax=Streptomyces sp. NPDC057686 TaxID=3346212 RepID=UPI0036C363D1
MSFDASNPHLDVKGRPQSGTDYLESLRDNREVWIYGERVEDVTVHPAFRNCARSIARLYDALHDPAQFPVLLRPTDTGNGGMTHPFFKVAYSKDDLRASRDAIEAWQRLTFGWLGRSPDYMASFLATLGANPNFFGEYAANARFWYLKSQEDVLHVGHAIVNPPVDRAHGNGGVKDVYVHVETETDSGLIVSGAKVVATGAPTTQYILVSHFGAEGWEKEFSVTFMTPTAGQGVKILARASYEEVMARSASPFDYPLSSRLDENDAILIFDRALIPWENILIYDTDTIGHFKDESGFLQRAILQASTRLSVKLDFLAGALSKALDITGAGQFRGVQAALGEVISWRHLVAGIRDGMIEGAKPGFGGAADPCLDYALAHAAIAPKLYSRIREIVETVVASGLIYLNSNAVDFNAIEMRPYLDRYLRGSGGNAALSRSKTMKLLWDSIGSEFGARHELYELNYFSQPETNHIRNFLRAQHDGTLNRMRGLVEVCMSDYDVTGWTAPDLINSTDVNFITRKGRSG